MLVRVATAKLTGLRADGKDLCFAQGENHDRLLCEVESWDPEGDVLIWVCVKKAARGESFTMLWGSENDYATRSRYTWSGYTSVVHFSDSTKPVVSSVDAKAGACVDSKWTENGYVAGGVDGPKTRIATPFAALADKSKFTASVWVKPSANSATTRLISSKGGYGAVTVAEGATLSLAVAEDVSANQVRGGTYTILSATDGIAGDVSEIVAPKKSWKVNKVMGEVVTEEGAVEKVVALTATVPGSGFAIVAR